MLIVSSGFGFEVKVTAKVAKLKVAIYEVPISYYGRTYEEGKKITFKDGLLAFWLVIRFNLFCSLRASFREQPEIMRKRNDQLRDAGIEMRGSEHRVLERRPDNGFNHLARLSRDASLRKVVSTRG